MGVLLRTAAAAAAAALSGAPVPLLTVRFLTFRAVPLPDAAPSMPLSPLLPLLPLRWRLRSTLLFLRPHPLRLVAAFHTQAAV